MRKSILIFSATVLVVVAGVGGYLATRDVADGENPLVAGEGPLQEQLEMTRLALSETENLQLVRADANWSRLHEQSPGDRSVSLNRALNRVLRVDALAAQATNAALDVADKKEARSKLPDAISSARAAVDAFAGLAAPAAADASTAMWLDAEVDLQEASLLPGSMTRSIRKEVYNRLSETIRGESGAQPGSAILGGVLAKVIDQMEDPIDGLPADILSDAADAFSALSDNHPDNLFFALRAARLNIETENERAADFIRRSRDLTSAIEPMINENTRTIGLTPRDLVDQITGAIESGDWQTAENRNLLWFNVLNSSEMMKTDRRRALPHPLDRLNFDSLRRLSAEQEQRSPIEKGTASIQFEPVTLPDSADCRFLATIDFDLDLQPDLAGIDEDGRLRIWKNAEQGWSSVGEVSTDLQPSGLIVADLFVVDSSSPGRLKADRSSAKSDEPISSSRHDTFLHLIVFGEQGVAVVSVDGRSGTAAEERLQIVDQDLGLSELRGVVAAVAGDLEADGDLDLVFATENDGVRMFINRGNRTFFELKNLNGGFDKDARVSSLAIADLDRDLDLDIVTTHGQAGRVGILENMLHLQFRARFLETIPVIEGAATIAVEEVDGNVSWDLIIGGTESSAIVFSHTSDAGVWVVDHVETIVTAGDDAVVADFDNDSWMETIAGDAVMRCGPWGWDEGTSVESLKRVADSSKFFQWIDADFDRDGGIDLAAATQEGVVIMQNQTASRGHYLEARFKGIDDNASGRVNHYAIGSVLEARFGPHYRAKIVTSPSTHFGLDGLDSAGSLRAILPNGLTQTTADPPIDSLVEEEQTLKGSCPYLYAWDGEKFAFVTDCLWAAPLGLQVARGVVAQDRPWEYLKLDGRNIRPKEGQYEFRITEELWEVAYFDQVELTVVDHPVGVDVWTNEKVGPADIATPTIFAFESEDRHPIHDAVDTGGTNVTEKLASVDQDFVQGFDRRLRQGLCERHWIDLDFGDALIDLPSTRNIYLVLTGWIMPTDASLNIQIDQNPDLLPIEFPSVWVPDSKSDSGWAKAIDYMGFPGGKTKTIVVDVTDVANVDDPRFRIRTSAQIYWDCAEVVVQSKPAPVRTQVCELVSAEVTFHGFSRRVKNGPQRPETYDYRDASSAMRWPPLRGPLTRAGDCLELLRTWDDSMVVISGGDEIQLRFLVPNGEPPEGWTRDFVLHSVGWDKDADLNTLAGQQIGPLPFKGMQQYPPGVGQRDAAIQVERINQNHLGRSQTFRSFWYREPKPSAMRFE